MSSPQQSSTQSDAADRADTVEMPAPTIAPLVLALGLTLLALGAVTRPAFLVVGAVVFIVGLARWVANLLPGRGHEEETLAAEPTPPAAAAEGVAAVERMREGLPGHRLRLPEKVHPISAGVRGGIVGGLVMPIPALLYGVLSGHGIWYPVNLLTGMVLPGIGSMSAQQLSQFNLTLTVVAVLIHVVMALVIGLLYGVLMPMLPEIPKPFSWGGLLMPLLWTGVTFAGMGMVNPVLAADVAWPWFIASQFLFGLAAAFVVVQRTGGGPLSSAIQGLLGGIAGGLLMPGPALAWALARGHSIWYPVNLLAGMVQRGMDNLPASELEKFHEDWFLQALAIHAALSLGFGLVYGLLLRRVPQIPGPLAWGGLLLPLLWTATSYGLMGVVNPSLEHRVDWPWFIVSQFVFGLATALVVVRSEKIPIEPVRRRKHLANPDTNANNG